MAKTPMMGAAAPPSTPDDAGAAPADAGTPAPDDGEDEEDPAAGGDDPGDENVLLTVCKEADGTYSLIKGDEEDADGADAAGSADVPGSPAESNKQSFDSKGALLKAILDILDDDESSTGGGGSADDQFQAGFGGGAGSGADAGAAGGAGAAPMPQKY